MVVPDRPPMWLVDKRFWHAHPDADPIDRSRLWTEAVSEWIERFGQRPGFDPFDDEGAFLLDQAEAAIRRGERW